MLRQHLLPLLLPLLLRADHEQVEQRNQQQEWEAACRGRRPLRGGRSRPPYQTCHEIHRFATSFARSAGRVKPASGTGAHRPCGRSPEPSASILSPGMVPLRPQACHRRQALKGEGSAAQRRTWCSCLHAPHNPCYRLLPVRHSSPFSTRRAKSGFRPGSSRPGCQKKASVDKKCAAGLVSRKRGLRSRDGDGPGRERQGN